MKSFIACWRRKGCREREKKNRKKRITNLIYGKKRTVFHIMFEGGRKGEGGHGVEEAEDNEKAETRQKEGECKTSRRTEILMCVLFFVFLFVGVPTS